MGKRAYSIIGKAKQHFQEREFNVEVIKNYIDFTLNQ